MNNLIGIKKLNRKKLYEFIYQSGETSKQAIADALGLSLPTVKNNLNTLMKDGLIEKCGYYKSTGGRKAYKIRCVKTAKFSVGAAIFKGSVRICAIDLYGSMLTEISHKIPYKDNDNYYEKICKHIISFIESTGISKKRLIGIAFATQGLISQDGSEVIYGTILHNKGQKAQAFSRFLDYPCILVHDTKASATAEIWKNSDTENAIYLLLNNNFGGVLVSRGKVHSGGSGLIEHMIIHPNGEKCYCGKKGCVEAYCSANALKKSAGMHLDIFFKKLRNGNEHCKEVWRNYLEELALTIDNIRMIINYKVILGGLLRQYMNYEDINQLIEIINEKTAFNSISVSVKLSKYGQNAASIGAAIYYIQSYLDTIY
ncbi:ROK family transcriptional regulator [Treponema parvum]|uniref:ROK family transcriptional regulator n=1 Tax=Treponema parvum TaxID=138851 RepID=A0A975F219_9SPIR|nr:ROK family transcriptional regulator [Treponema parvum]QTQ12992.1 ROK family transcriptional regulator [Treponema parvum]